MKPNTCLFVGMLGLLAHSIVPLTADGITPAQVPVILRELCRAVDLAQPHSVEFQAHVVLSRWRRCVVSWEKGQVTSTVQEFRYSSAAGGSVLWYEASKEPGDRAIRVSREPFFIGSYQNRDYVHFSNAGPLRNGLRIQASCVFQSWATDARVVGIIPSEHFQPLGPWHRVIAYQATPLLRSGMTPVENGDGAIGPAQDEFRKVPFRLAGASYFTLPGQNRHFGGLMQLLQFDPLLTPHPLLLGWVGGVDPTVVTVADPSLHERPLPRGSRAAGQAADTGASNQD